MNDVPKPYETPELQLEGRFYFLAIVLIVVAIYTARLAVEVDFLDRRMTRAEAAVKQINRTHTTP